MKRVSYVIGGVIAIAVIWTGGWFAGKSFLIEPEADRIVEELRAGNLFFSYESRDVGGFPIAYDVAYRGVKVSSEAGGWEWTAPSMSVASGVADGGAVIVTPADETKLVVRANYFGGAEDAAPAVFDIASEGLSFTLTEWDDHVAVFADRFEAVQAAGGGALKDARASFAPLTGSVLAAPDLDMMEAAIESGEARIAYVLSPDGVTENRADTKLRGVKASFKGARLSAGSLAGFLAADGEAAFSVAAEAFESEAGTAGGPDATPLDIAVTSGRTTADFTVSEGRARYAASLSEAEYKVSSEQPAPIPGGAFSIGGGEFLVEAPVVKTEAPAPYALRFTLTDLVLDDALWAAFDPEGKIDRTPFAVKADVGGEAMVIHPLGSESFGESPIDLETVDIKDLSLTGLGASVEATGALSVSGVTAAPEGKLKVQSRGAFALLDQIAAAGLIPPEQVQLFKALALGYARQGDTPDHLIAEIETSLGGVSINGKPLQ